MHLDQPSWYSPATALNDLLQVYQATATGPPFGMLLIGDHSNHQAGYSAFDDRIWITGYARSATEVPRLIVIGVLPIGRPTPSALRRSLS
ncbi:hypothetical protein [Streptomyces sp. H27-D2]|uniref:hypothetical protein n=1 Tax=Streptomyces sp. H27-D2 TaxID=3046304 RepID=UPI002DBE1593|nr:hypothetical protein [Streptomyces sp. H27-D2]MEC4015485.1 hypothetical protein [Streptomyces sp. H27-D2]